MVCIWGPCLPNRSKYWQMKYRFGGKEKRLAFGVYPLISYASVSEKALLSKGEVVEGNDPGEIKKIKIKQTSVGIEHVFGDRC